MAALTYLAAVRVTNTKRMEPQLAPGAWVPPAKASTIRDEILRKCDALDGLEDGVINNYIACNRLFDPTITPSPLVGIRCKDGRDTGNDCLSDAQISAIDAIHAPFSFGYPLTNGETDFPGFPTVQKVRPAGSFRPARQTVTMLLVRLTCGTISEIRKASIYTKLACRRSSRQ